MKTARIPIPMPELALIAVTRGMLGAGIGLLAANKLKDAKRRVVGLGLFLVGVLSTVPLAMDVMGKRSRVIKRRKV